MTYIYSHPMFC